MRNPWYRSYVITRELVADKCGSYKEEYEKFKNAESEKGNTAMGGRRKKRRSTRTKRTRRFKSKRAKRRV
jgi:hypothetical protein